MCVRSHRIGYRARHGWQLVAKHCRRVLYAWSQGMSWLTHLYRTIICICIECHPRSNATVSMACLPIGIEGVMQVVACPVLPQQQQQQQQLHLLPCKQARALSSGERGEKRPGRHSLTPVLSLSYVSSFTILFIYIILA